MMDRVHNSWFFRRLFVLMVFSIGVVPCLFPQSRVVTAHIQDAETGEALPYAYVFISDEKRTLSNAEGDFSIMANAEDTLLIRYMGFVSQRIAVPDLKAVVKLRPSSVQMREVTVVPIGSILDRVQEQLRYSLSKGVRLNNTYFCRMLEDFGARVELIEAFVNAKSAVHLRDLSVITGKHNRLDEGDGTLPALGKMNLHHFFELGPLMADNVFWNGLVDQPFNGNNLKKLYKYDYTVQDEGDGRTVYVVNLKPSSRANAGRIMRSTAFIDAKTYRLLRFKCVTPTMYMMNKLDDGTWQTEVYTTFTIEYAYSKDGVAEVSDISFETKGTGVHATGLMLSTQGLDLSKVKGRKVENNVIASIENAGFDSIMWEHSNFVQRTQREEEIAQRQVRSGQENVYLHLDQTHYITGDTVWFSAHSRDLERNRPSLLSKVLYVELLRQDSTVRSFSGTELLARKKVLMDEGHGHGFFALGDSVAEGAYRLRAYTRWQKNWMGDSIPFYGKPFHVSRPVAEDAPADLAQTQTVGSGHITIDSLRPHYAPHEKITLKVHVDAPIDYAQCHLSIAVRAAERQLQKNVSDNIMVLGHKHVDVALPAQPLHPKERTFMLRGRALRNGRNTLPPGGEEGEQLGNRPKDKRREAYIFFLLRSDRGDMKLVPIETNNEGHFEKRVPLFYGECLLYVDATDAISYKLQSHKWKLPIEANGKVSYPKTPTKPKPALYDIELNVLGAEDALQAGGYLYGYRCIPLKGLSYPATFGSTGYAEQALPEGRSDYRRTLYWNPDLTLNENGEAEVTFYNNSRTTSLSIEIEGQAADGTLLWGQW